MEAQISEKGKSLEQPPNPVPGEGKFLEGMSPSMRAVEAVMVELAQSKVPVLLLAEAGAGKRTIARRIHERSGCKAEEFRIIGCAGLVPERLGSSNGKALFIHGTVFLEEIGDLSSACQLKLLDLLPQVEGNGKHPVHTRLICGSARDLEAEVRSGRFREDLYYRINGVCLRLPPLRQRREDIPLLVNFFLTEYAQDFRRPMPVLSAQTQQLFHDYAWPGNIRELQNFIERSVILTRGPALQAPVEELEKNDVFAHKVCTLADADRVHIIGTLQETNWVVGGKSGAASRLGLNRTTLVAKMRKLGISRETVEQRARLSNSYANAPLKGLSVPA